jgi:hypothetical protein
MDRKAEEETNGSAIRDDGRGPRDNRAAISWGGDNAASRRLGRADGYTHLVHGRLVSR